MLSVLFVPPLMEIFEVKYMYGQWGIIAILSVAPLVIVEIAKGIMHLFKKAG